MKGTVPEQEIDEIKKRCVISIEKLKIPSFNRNLIIFFQNKMISLAVVNQKGGRKDYNGNQFEAAIAEKNFKVLLIDLDPQGNSTMGSGVEKIK